MDCPACRHDNRSDASFCDRCGALLALVCGSCGRELREGARFCDSCGQAVEAAGPGREADPRSYTPPHLAARILRDRPMLEGERRNVTVLFIDAAGSVSATEQIERADPEELHRIVHGCTERMIEAVHRYEGTVTQFRGDGIMAVFGAPIAHEDSARRGVGAALAMRDSLASYERDVRTAGGHGFTYRIGLNSGPVIVGRIGDDLSMDYTAIGDTVNLAARMEQWASPGAVYVTEATRKLTAPYFEFRDLGNLEVKGKSETVHVLEVVRELSARTRLDIAAERGLSPYVGRSQEASTLRTYFEQSQSARGQVVFISGEAGIGKSRLLLEFRKSLPGDLRWVEGHCISYGKSIPYLPIIDLIKRIAGVQETDDDGAIIGRIEALAAEWEEPARATVPYLRFLLNVDSGDPAVTAMDPLGRRAGLLDALRTMLAQESTRHRLVVVVEDLHWIDQQSDEALSALVDVVAATRVLLLLTYRPGYAHSLGDRTYYNRLALRQLDPEESSRLAQGVLGGAALPAGVRELITAKSEGNPFYTEEVAKSLVESGVLRREDGAYQLTRELSRVVIPDTIQEIILTRIDRLHQDARSAIQLASVIGREFTARLLQRISDLETRLGGVLAELKALELIYEKAYFPELSYMFKHALTHEVALSTLLATRRKALHRIVAASVEELYADRIAEHYETLAYHYEEGEEWPKALDYLLKAAAKAAAAYANREAIAFNARAIEVAERLGEWSTAWDAGHANMFLQNIVGDFDGATAERMLSACAHLGDRRREGNTLLYRGVWEFWAHVFDRSEASMREALAIGDEGYEDVRFTSMFWLGSSLYITGRHAEALPFLEATTELSPAVEDAYHIDWWSLSAHRSVTGAPPLTTLSRSFARRVAYRTRPMTSSSG